MPQGIGYPTLSSATRMPKKKKRKLKPAGESGSTIRRGTGKINRKTRSYSATGDAI